jgi:hypothetical protein
VLAGNLAADLDAWTGLLGLHDVEDLADAEPDTPRGKRAQTRLSIRASQPSDESRLTP